MPFSDRQKVSRFVGHALELQPVYGWGWSPDFPFSPPPDGLPERSLFELTAFTEELGEWSGGVGRLAESGSPISGMFIAFLIRLAGDFDLSHTIPYCNLMLRSESAFTADEEVSWITRPPSGSLMGYGYIGAPGFALP